MPIRFYVQVQNQHTKVLVFGRFKDEFWCHRSQFIEISLKAIHADIRYSICKVYLILLVLQCSKYCCVLLFYVRLIRLFCREALAVRKPVEYVCCLFAIPNRAQDAGELAGADICPCLYVRVWVKLTKSSETEQVCERTMTELIIVLQDEGLGTTYG